MPFGDSTRKQRGRPHRFGDEGGEGQQIGLICPNDRIPEGGSPTTAFLRISHSEGSEVRPYKTRQIPCGVIGP